MTLHNCFLTAHIVTPMKVTQKSWSEGILLFISKAIGYDYAQLDLRHLFSSIFVTTAFHIGMEGHKHV